MADIGFHEIEDAIIITRSKGVHKQCKAFQRKGFVYVQIGGGFVMMRRNGGTNLPHVMWEDIELRIDTVFDELGRMAVKK